MTQKSARDQISSELGISNQTISHLRYIRKHRPDVLPHIGVSITLAAAGSQVKLFENQKKIMQDTSKKNDDIDLNGFNFELFTKSSADMSELEADSIDAVITSPPYFQMRQFSATGTNGNQPELGQEDTIEEYIDNLLEVMAEVKRVMKPTASLMLNLGDSYHNGGLFGIPARVSIALADRLGESRIIHRICRRCIDGCIRLAADKLAFGGPRRIVRIPHGHACSRSSSQKASG